LAETLSVLFSEVSGVCAAVYSSAATRDWTEQDRDDLTVPGPCRLYAPEYPSLIHIAWIEEKCKKTLRALLLALNAIDLIIDYAVEVDQSIFSGDLRSKEGTRAWVKTTINTICSLADFLHVSIRGLCYAVPTTNQFGAFERLETIRFLTDSYQATEGNMLGLLGMQVSFADMSTIALNRVVGTNRSLYVSIILALQTYSLVPTRPENLIASMLRGMVEGLVDYSLLGTDDHFRFMIREMYNDATNQHNIE
jgi:hypothetical protein